MPWKVFEEDDQHCVYRIDEDDQPMGDSMGCHGSAEEAQAQVDALYASEEQASQKAGAMKKERDGEHPASHYLVATDPDLPTTWHLRVMGMDGEPDHRLMGAAWAALNEGYRGNVYEGPRKREALAKLKRLYKQEDMPLPVPSEKAAPVVTYGVKAIEGGKGNEIEILVP